MASGLFMGLLGLIGSFLPEELLSYAGAPSGNLAVLFIQVAGALYVGFAVLNWTAKGTIMGGIYGRPIALGNFLHFAVVAIALVKALLDGVTSVELLVGAVAYSAFAISFGAVLFNHPKKKDEKQYSQPATKIPSATASSR